jgi:hypothetical protein
LKYPPGQLRETVKQQEARLRREIDRRGLHVTAIYWE